MARVIGSHHSHPLITPRNLVQRTCITVGILFILMGLVGIIMPGFMGMHLSLGHNLIHLLSGSLALWCGYADEPRRAYTFCILFGAFYGILAVAGYVMGKPGYPSVGHMDANQNLLRVIPNVLELGTQDHIVHFLLSAVFLVSAYAWKRREVIISKNVVDEQARMKMREETELGPELQRYDLGDIPQHRPNDERPYDYESRI